MVCTLAVQVMMGRDLTPQVLSQAAHLVHGDMTHVLWKPHWKKPLVQHITAKSLVPAGPGKAKPTAAAPSTGKVGAPKKEPKNSAPSPLPAPAQPVPHKEDAESGGLGAMSEEGM